VRHERRHLLLLGAIAVALTVAQAVTGMDTLVLTLGPPLLIFGLLLSGRYLGEERILTRRLARAPLPRARVRRRWARGHERALASLLARRACPKRGPPAGAAA
jgi:hypothetical protein